MKIKFSLKNIKLGEELFLVKHLIIFIFEAHFLKLSPIFKML